MNTHPSTLGPIAWAYKWLTQLKPGKHLALIFLLAICPHLIAQDFNSDQTKALAKAMITQNGLHLPQDVPDIFSLIEHQSRQSECEEIDVRWTSMPGSNSIPAKKADALDYPQAFSQLARRTQPGCDRASYRAWASEFPIVQFIVFGTTKDGEIHGLHADKDPREWIAECPEFFGGKSTPDTACGIMVKPTVTTTIHMPKDKQIVNLVFFRRRYTSLSEWHLERLGSLELDASKHE